MLHQLTLFHKEDLKILFDVIFLDPPYEKGLIDEALEGIAKFNLLKENGIISFNKLNFAIPSNASSINPFS
jgi:16S rRNA G966 N2-methylase RsmD